MIFNKKQVYVLAYFLFCTYFCVCAMNDSLASRFSFINTFSKTFFEQSNIDEENKNSKPINLYVINEPDLQPNNALMTKKLEHALSDKKASFYILVHYKTVENMFARKGLNGDIQKLASDQIQFVENIYKNWILFSRYQSEYVLFVPLVAAEPFAIFNFDEFSFDDYIIKSNSDSEKICIEVVEELLGKFLPNSPLSYKCSKTWINDKRKKIKNDIPNLQNNLQIIDEMFLPPKKENDQVDLLERVKKIDDFLRKFITVVEKIEAVFNKEHYIEGNFQQKVQNILIELRNEKKRLSAWSLEKSELALVGLWNSIKKKTSDALVFISKEIVLFKQFCSEKSGLPEALESIFEQLVENNKNKKNNGRKICLYVTGHGSEVPQKIADLSSGDMRLLLGVCNKVKNLLHVFVVDSCFTAGPNRNMLLDLNNEFPLIIIGVDDLPTISVLHESEGFPGVIFDLLNSSLGNIDGLNDLCLSHDINNSLHMYENMPIMFNHKKKNAIVCSEKNCYILDKSHIGSSITVIPATIVLYVFEDWIVSSLKITTKKYSEKTSVFLDHLLCGIPLTEKEYCLFSPKENGAMPVVNPTVQEAEKESCMYLFPAFIPHKQQPVSYFYIKKITSNQNLGVWKILRDMFLNAAHLSSSRSIYIRAICDRNDLYGALLASRKVNGIAECSNFEKELVRKKRDDGNKAITLSRVYIFINPGDEGNMHYEVAFCLGAKAWIWRHDTKSVAASMVFKNTSKRKYKKIFDDCIRVIWEKKKMKPDFTPDTCVRKIVQFDEPLQEPKDKKGVKRKERSEDII